MYLIPWKRAYVKVQVPGLARPLGQPWDWSCGLKMDAYCKGIKNQVLALAELGLTLLSSYRYSASLLRVPAPKLSRGATVGGDLEGMTWVEGNFSVKFSLTSASPDYDTERCDKLGTSHALGA